MRPSPGHSGTRWLWATGILLLAGCTFQTPFGNSDYPPCRTNDDCFNGCVCLNAEICVPPDGIGGPERCFEETHECTSDPDCEPHCVCDLDQNECVPPVATTYPDYCESGPPECESSTDCQHECMCEAFTCVPTVETSYPDYCLNGPPECEHDRECLFGCHCVEFECMPPIGRPEDYCDSGIPECVDDRDCKLGCICESEVCTGAIPGLPEEYCGFGLSATCMPPDIWVNTNLDIEAPPAGQVSLRMALIEATETAGPHRIAFQNGGLDGSYVVNKDLGPLPPVPDLTYLDGGEGVVIQSQDGMLGTGIIVDGTGVVVSDLTVKGFSDTAVLIGSFSSDVHLFRMRIGEPVTDGSNGTGIDIRPNTRHIVIGRGRELECVAPRVLPANPRDPSLYDINVIVANTGDGIHALQVEDLSISGTWIGFNNFDDIGRGNWQYANEGRGIVLDQVERAVVGAQHLTEEEKMQSTLDPYPAFVGVGRSNEGGVVITGGGDIFMPGLMIGDTPIMDPFDENGWVNLLIEGNTGPVHYGPSPYANDIEARYFGLVYSELAIPIQITNNQATVWIRGIQNECFWDWGEGCAHTAVSILNPQAPVKLHHMSFVSDSHESAIEVLDMQDEGSLELINNLFYRDEAGGPPVLFSNSINVEHITISSNVKYHFADWCNGECPVVSTDTNIDTGSSFECEMSQIIPTGVNCPNVDTGEEIPIDENGGVMNLTGIPDQTYHGCGPDIGFIECSSPACRNKPCD